LKRRIIYVVIYPETQDLLYTTLPDILHPNLSLILPILPPQYLATLHFSQLSPSLVLGTINSYLNDVSSFYLVPPNPLHPLYTVLHSAVWETSKKCTIWIL
jgi:hypothetical protein